MALAKHTKKGLQDLLKSLTILPCAKPFMKPIDPVALEIEDYFEVVTKPIDLGTIRKKLISDGYSDPYELFSDFDLLIENVRVYFTDLDDPMRCKAEHLQELFNKQWKNFIDKPAPEEAKPRKRIKVVEEDLTEKDRLITFFKKVKASTAYEYLQNEDLEAIDLEPLQPPEIREKLQDLVLNRIHSIPSIHCNTVNSLWTEAQRKRPAAQLNEHLDFDALTGWTPNKIEEELEIPPPTPPPSPPKPSKPAGLSVKEYIRATQVAFVEASAKVSYRELLVLMFY